MENSRIARKSICTWCSDLAHHVDHDRTGAAQRQLNVTAGIARPQTGTDLGMGSRDGKAAHGNRAKTGNRDLTIRRDGQLVGALGSTINIHDYLIARPQDIILRRSDIHARLKREAAVIKDIVAENLLACSLVDTARGLNILLYLLDVFTCILGNRTRRTHLRSVQILGCRIVCISLETIDRGRDCTISRHSDATVAQLLVILVAQTANLINLHTALYQTCHYLRLRPASLMLTGNVLNDLLVAHTLSKARHHTEHTNK